MSYFTDTEDVRECGGCEDAENHPHAFDCESYSNPYAPKYYIWVVYPDGYSRVITGGNAKPAKAVTYSDNDVENALASFREAERKRGGIKTFHAELIGDRTWHL